MLNPNSTPTCGILYIDDEEKALKYFRMAFGQKFQVFTAASGADGLEILRKEARNIGIVISDQRMPGMSGAEFLSTVRDEYPHVVRILTTAYSDLESAIQAVNKGHIYQYVVKPWEIPELGMILQRAADYFLVISERNQLLALKMNTLQKIICGDRLKSLLLAARSWPEDRRSPFLRALGALIAGLPADGSAFLPKARGYQARDFDMTALIRDSFRSCELLLGSLDDAASLEPDDLQARLGEALGAGAVQVSGKDGAWTVDLDASVTREAALQNTFGALAARDLSPAAIGIVQALTKLSGEGGSLRVLQGGVPVAEFSPSATSESEEELMEALYGKYEAWDIQSL